MVIEGIAVVATIVAIERLIRARVLKLNLFGLEHDVEVYKGMSSTDADLIDSMQADREKLIRQIETVKRILDLPKSSFYDFVPANSDAQIIADRKVSTTHGD